MKNYLESLSARTKKILLLTGVGLLALFLILYIYQYTQSRRLINSIMEGKDQITSLKAGMLADSIAKATLANSYRSLEAEYEELELENKMLVKQNQQDKAEIAKERDKVKEMTAEETVTRFYENTNCYDCPVILYGRDSSVIAPLQTLKQANVDYVNLADSRNEMKFLWKVVELKDKEIDNLFGRNENLQEQLGKAEDETAKCKEVVSVTNDNASKQAVLDQKALKKEKRNKRISQGLAVIGIVGTVILLK